MAIVGVGKDLSRFSAEPPPRKLSLLFLHHSCGTNLLRDGLRELLQANNYEVHEAGYGDAIGEHTDPGDFIRTFGEQYEEVKGWDLPPGRQHDVIMFKSCYPACAIASEAMLQQYKDWYAPILKVFQAHPEKLFVPLSPPPLNPNGKMYQADQAVRARAFADWLTSEYGADVPNVFPFDLFGAIADRETHGTRTEFQRADRPGDSHPNEVANRTAATALVPLLNRAVRAARLVR
jgi:hypothetical protein